MKLLLLLLEPFSQTGLVLAQSEQVALQQDDGRLANAGAVDRRLLLDVVFEVFRLGKVDGNHALLELRRRDLVRLARDLLLAVSGLCGRRERKGQQLTPPMTTSLAARHCSSDMSHFLMTWYGWKLDFLPSSPSTTFFRVNSCTPSRSTEKTRAPSLASNAASGRPTTSDRFTTVMVRPNAREPYGRRGLYTWQCSRVLTIASGVQGRIALTRPSGVC